MARELRRVVTQVGRLIGIARPAPPAVDTTALVSVMSAALIGDRLL
ncbi:MAG: hypothetical protein ACREPA_06035 [Candidatus Dormibacteraceae bacterium]